MVMLKPIKWMYCYYQCITIIFVLFYVLLLTIMPFLSGSLLFARNGESLNLTSCKKGFLERMHLLRNLGGKTYYLGTFRTGQSLLSTLSVMEFSAFAHLSSSFSTGCIPQLTLASCVQVGAQTLSCPFCLMSRTWFWAYNPQAAGQAPGGLFAHHLFTTFVLSWLQSWASVTQSTGVPFLLGLGWWYISEDMVVCTWSFEDL